MNIRKAILVVSSVILLVLSCTKTEIETFGQIFGTVTDSETKQPIAGANVVLSPGGEVKVTGEDGKYSFAELTTQSYSLQISKEGYQHDSRTLTVVAGKSTQLDISLMNIVPEMSVNVSRLDFAGDKSLLSLEISNVGKGELSWEIHKNEKWVGVSLAAGKTQREKSTVVVSVNREGLAAGDYNTTIVVSSDGGSKEIAISMSVTGAALIVTPIELNFGEILTSNTLTLRNLSGIGNLSYSISKSNEWITVDKNSGSLNNIQTSTIISVGVNRSDMTAGSYTASLTITSSVSEPIVVPIIMSVKINQQPTVSIGMATDIKHNSAKISGTVISIGSAKITEHGFCYSKSANPTINDSKTNNGDRSVTGLYDGILSNLETNVKYYVKAYATNAVGTAYSDEYVFTTSQQPILAVVKTADAQKLGVSGVEMHGEIISIGFSDINEHGFIYSASEQDLNSSNKGIKVNLGNKGKEVGTFNKSLQALEPGTRYFFKAYAANEVGESYGDILNFTTFMADPTIGTKDATDILHNKATSGGNIISSGGNTFTEKGVCWSKTNHNPTIDDSKVVSVEATNDFSANLTGLDATTLYYTRAYVKTANNTYYGDVKKFTTTIVKELATVETNEVKNITIDGATIYCYIPKDGNSSVTSRGICWSITPNPTVANSKLTAGSGTGNYTVDITGLSLAQKVYVRAYAVNEIGTAYGEELSFTTRSSNVIYVSKTRGDNNHSGDSWADAKATIANAIENAPKGYQVWIDNATYTEPIELKDGVNVYGGFEGTESNISQRSAESYTTILRNSITQDADFSSATICDGFIVSSNISAYALSIKKNGKANNLKLSGNVLCVSIKDGELSNSSVVNNTCSSSAIPNVIDAGKVFQCKFENNQNPQGTLISVCGGGMVESCSIINNSTDYYNNTGNIIYIFNGGVVKKCNISNNKGRSDVVKLYGGTFLLEGNLMNNNTSSSYYYVVVYVQSSSSTTITNNSFINCQSYYVFDSKTTFANNVIWSSSTTTFSLTAPVGCYITNCAIKGGYASGTNIINLTDENGAKPPRFNADWTLQSSSPLINAGDNSFLSKDYTKDLNGSNRIKGGRVDIGAYEY